jgi:hypothetical protein
VPDKVDEGADMRRGGCGGFDGKELGEGSLIADKEDAEAYTELIEDVVEVPVA